MKIVPTLTNYAVVTQNVTTNHSLWTIDSSNSVYWDWTSNLLINSSYVSTSAMFLTVWYLYTVDSRYLELAYLE